MEVAGLESAVLTKSERLRVWEHPEVTWAASITERTISWISAEVEDVLGWTPNEVVGLPYEQVFPEHMDPSWRADVRQAIRDGHAGYYETVALHKDGHEVPIAGYARPFKVDGKTIGMNCGFSRFDVVRSSAMFSETIMETMDHLFGTTLNGASRDAISDFVFALVSGQRRGLFIQTPERGADLGEVYARTFESIPTAEVLERVMTEALGGRLTERSRVRTAAEVLTGQRPGIALVKVGPDGPCKFATLRHTAKVTVEDAL